VSEFQKVKKVGCEIYENTVATRAILYSNKYRYGQKVEWDFKRGIGIFIVETVRRLMVI